MHRNKSVNVHQFSMVPKAEIPRSSFKREWSHKTAIDAGYLIPVYVDEMLPGDTFNVSMTAFARLATPLFPTMDNLHLESFFFFAPMRILWEHTEEFFGQQDTPGASTDYVIPQIVLNPGGAPVGSIYDYFGLGTVGQIDPVGEPSYNVLPLRMYNRVFNDWFRDENLVNPATVNVGDGPDAEVDYLLYTRGKRHDYFTSCLPWPQKGPTVTLPLGTTAPVFGTGGGPTGLDAISVKEAIVGGAGPNHLLQVVAGQNEVDLLVNATNSTSLTFNNIEQPLYVDLSAAVAATVNDLRLAFQTQKLFERDARGGTRYNEMVMAHFGVRPPDFRLQRPEYIGGGHTMVQISPVPQTSATNIEGSDTPQGSLAAIGTALASNHGFVYSATEHGYVLGLINVRADINYQQGTRRMWFRETRLDFYHPVFAAIGEQAVLTREIWERGVAAVDQDVFGYQEAWAEYRYFPSMITGLMRSTAADTLDPWHYAQDFDAQPLLNDTFITDATRNTLARSLTFGDTEYGKQLIVDMFFVNRSARPMPLYSVPGLIDHF